MDTKRGRFFTMVSVSIASCFFLLGGCQKHNSTSDENRVASSDEGVPFPFAHDDCERLEQGFKTVDKSAEVFALRAINAAICTVMKGANFFSNPGRSISNLGAAIQDSIKSGRKDKLKGVIGAELAAKAEEIAPYFQLVLTDANIPGSQITADQVTRVALAAIAYDSIDLNVKRESQTRLKDSKGEKISSEQMQKAWGKGSNPVLAFDLVGDSSYLLGKAFAGASRAEVLTFAVKKSFSLDTSKDPLALKNLEAAYALGIQLMNASALYLKEIRDQ